MMNVMMIVMAMMMTTTILLGEATGQAPPIPAEEQPEVLMRGPVNESFAQPVNLEIQVGFTVPIEPPAYIEEIPPLERPAGEQFAWVPGYWAWDSDRNGYVWVSGCWRAVPPDMYWVPGYWARAARGWQWVAGFWAQVGNNAIEYLPAPPALTNVEPPGPPPSPDRMWVPPCWYWNHGQYIRRPGYWIVAQTDWVWVPSHYIWTPRGYVLANGHWDYTLERRGVLFAPVYFPRHSYERPGFTFALSIVLDFDNLEAGLFTRPRYNHYYFGDYYDSSYISIGIFPWFEFEQRHTWYDPIYVHTRWRHHQREPRWVQHNRQEYERRRSDRSLRPPRTYREMESRASTMSEPKRRNFEIAAPITRVVASRTTPLTYERSKPEIHKQLPKHAEEVRRFGRERSRWEAQGAARQTGQPDSEKRGSSGKTPEKTVPAVRTERGEKPDSGRKGAKASPEQQRPTAVAPRETRPGQPADEEHESSDSKQESTASEKPRTGTEMQPSPRQKPAPAVRTERDEKPDSDRKGAKTSPKQQQPTAVAPRETGPGQPAVEGHEASDRKQATTAPEKSRTGTEMQPSPRQKPAPAVRTERGEKPDSDQKGLKTSPEQQRPTAVTPRKSGQSHPDRVKVQTSPVADKKGGAIRRKKPPTPEEEQSNQKELDEEQGNRRGSDGKQRNPKGT